ncbi:MAG: DUF29 domain-containing protein [Runella slithyformis]|nr:MAG: DUF29 domain-containing protein [Runella slithyformis]TAF29685.1 MAG: DUF29 domain-containing protein [Runella slithyformis]TAF48504.1 MAG: DUF29 domain-containing protein [Runella slithyformis]TAF83302.1 MAG: DUF29 domain-containing protein [Runella slithyformis]
MVAVKPNWSNLSASSHYNLAKEIKFSLQEGDKENAIDGLNELIDSMSKMAIREMRSHLMILMLHIIKWNNQPQKRSFSWINSILNARDEIAEVMEETPSVTKFEIERVWQQTFQKAVRNAGYEMGMSSKELKKFEPTPLTWQEVFEDEYLLENND